MQSIDSPCVQLRRQRQVINRVFASLETQVSLGQLVMQILKVLMILLESHNQCTISHADIADTTPA